jgi:hypothetical protein
MNVAGGVFRRRHLPHWDVAGHPFFVTACLEGSISASGLKEIRQYREYLAKQPRPEKFGNGSLKGDQRGSREGSFGSLKGDHFGRVCFCC